MDAAIQQNAYYKAFEHARATIDQLNRDLELLDKRHAALLNATKALETMMAQRSERQPAPNQNLSAVVENGRTQQPANQRDTWGWKQTVTKTYVHEGDSPNDIQRRIDIAVGG